jgi:hypothetical protein
MVKPDIVVKFPGFSKNKGENKIEIHKNLTTTEHLNIKAKKGRENLLAKLLKLQRNRALIEKRVRVKRVVTCHPV